MKKVWGLVIDQERCIGCEACTVACQIENGGSEYRIRVITENVSQKDTPSGRFPNVKMSFQPQLCNHCTYPPCMDACPSDALVKRADGPVVLDDAKCDGCQMCMEVCPYDAIHYSSANDRVEKCNFCIHRIDQGLEPFCVICCEGQAIYFGDLNDPASRVAKIVAAGEAYQLKAETQTGPSVYYCPPKVPRKL